MKIMNKITLYNLSKRAITALLILVLIFAVSSTAFADNNALDAAWELYALGLFKGIGTNNAGQPEFDLNRDPSRFESVTMLVRLLGKEEEAQKLDYTAPFVDVVDWAKPYVNYAYIHGYTAGISAGKFGGEAKTLASQYITFILRALGYTSGVDFEWNRSWELSDKLGITNGEYNADSKFLRGDVAVISRNALSATVAGSEKTLRETCTKPVSLEVHFIDVGQADSTLIICDEHSMLIDGGNVTDSSLIYSYLKKHNVDHLDYIVCTHAHEDHVGGLSGALNYATVDTVFCPVNDYNTEPFKDFKKNLAKQGLSIIIPDIGQHFTLGSASVAVVGPVDKDERENNSSIVLRIVLGEISFLFTGDAERDEELAILEQGNNLKSTVLKVAHHGSSSSTTYPLLRETEAEYGIISVGKNNPYGHPTDDTLSKLRDAEVTVYRTDLDGDIFAKTDGTYITFETSKKRDTSNSDYTRFNTQLSGKYILNTNTHKFHYPDCRSVESMSEKNKLEYEGTRDEIIQMGYSPCGRCKP